MGILRKSNINQLTMETFMNSCLCRFKFFFYLYIEQLCSVIGQQITTELLDFPISGGRFLVTGQDCSAQCGHNNFDHNKGTGPGFFIIATGSEASHLAVGGRSHKNVHLAADSKGMMARFIEMQLITIYVHSVFICHCHLQHASAAWPGTESIRYHLYLIPHERIMMDAAAFAYGWIFRKVGDTVPTISSVFDVPTMPQVQEASGSGSQNSQGVDAVVLQTK